MGEEMIWIIAAVAIIYSITGGLVGGWNYRRLTDKELTEKERTRINKLWHNMKPLRDIAAVILGALFEEIDKKVFLSFHRLSHF